MKYTIIIIIIIMSPWSCQKVSSVPSLFSWKSITFYNSITILLNPQKLTDMCFLWTLNLLDSRRPKYEINIVPKCELPATLPDCLVILEPILVQMDGCWTELERKMCKLGFNYLMPWRWFFGDVSIYSYCYLEGVDVLQWDIWFEKIDKNELS